MNKITSAPLHPCDYLEHFASTRAISETEYHAALVQVERLRLATAWMEHSTMFGWMSRDETLTMAVATMEVEDADNANR